MFSDASGRTLPPHKIIKREKETYLEGLPDQDPEWTADVRAFFHDIRAHLFDEDLRVKDVRERCGTANHNISSRFKYSVGKAPKKYILYHRVELAKRLLRYEKLTVTQVAFAVGYGNPSAFSKVFKSWMAVTPSEYRKSRRK